MNGVEQVLYALTADERRIFLDIVEKVRKLPSDVVNIRPTDKTPATPHNNTDCYIVEIPNAGIPALSSGHPGKALCDVAQIVKGATASLALIGGLQIYVWNYTKNPISGGHATGTGGSGQYLTVIKDKYGSWVPATAPAASEYEYLGVLAHQLTNTVGTGSMGAVKINSLQPFDGSTPVDPTMGGTPSATSVEAYNYLNCAGPASQYVIIKYHAGLNQWIIMSVQNVVVNPLTGIQVVDPNYQTKFRSIAVNVNEPESNYANAILGADCTS